MINKFITFQRLLYHDVVSILIRSMIQCSFQSALNTWLGSICARENSQKNLKFCLISDNNACTSRSVSTWMAAANPVKKQIPATTHQCIYSTRENSYVLFDYPGDLQVNVGPPKTVHSTCRWKMKITWRRDTIRQ